jgi:argininosuccinate lyase
LLPVVAGALRSLRVRPERMRAAIDSTMMATDLADYLVEKGLPFRQAHALAGQAVQLALEQDKPLEALSLEQFQALGDEFGPIRLSGGLPGVRPGPKRPPPLAP